MLNEKFPDRNFKRSRSTILIRDRDAYAVPCQTPATNPSVSKEIINRLPRSRRRFSLFIAHGLKGPRFSASLHPIQGSVESGGEETTSRHLSTSQGQTIAQGNWK